MRTERQKEGESLFALRKLRRFNFFFLRHEKRLVYC